MTGATAQRFDPDPGSGERVVAPAYRRIVEKLEAGACVILDGATGTELPHLTDADRALDERLWGTRALVEQSAAVLRVHRRYVEVGCDVISTNTWGLPSALLQGAAPVWRSTEPVHWMDLARRGLQLARQARDDAGRSGDCAIAFSINGDVDAEDGDSTIRLLSRLFADDTPDLILLETLSVVRASLQGAAGARLESSETGATPSSGSASGRAWPGLVSASAARAAEICAGPTPQQPPTICAPSSRQRSAIAAYSSLPIPGSKRQPSSV